MLVGLRPAGHALTFQILPHSLVARLGPCCSGAAAECHGISLQAAAMWSSLGEAGSKCGQARSGRCEHALLTKAAPLRAGMRSSS